MSRRQRQQDQRPAAARRPSDDFQSVDFKSLDARENDVTDLSGGRSLLLIDEAERLQFGSADELCAALSCGADDAVKVVSIFGKTGDGKSHTLNHAFFDGRPVFATSDRPESSTVGVWAAYDAERKAVVLDTEGLQGVASNENQRTRLLLKILAVSDAVVYRIKADRLHNDMFAFLGDASRAYCEHFTQELQELALKEAGPVAVVFHETQHTEVLRGDEQLRQRFALLQQPTSAFASVQYVGQRSDGQPTNFEPLKKCLTRTLEKTDTRSPRPLRVVFRLLHALNEKFSGQIDDLRRPIFPDEYFTCSRLCVCCGARCTLTMNHDGDHLAAQLCRYVAERDNKVYLCERCYRSGRRTVVSYNVGARSDSGLMKMMRYTWSGYVLECPQCGVIHRSREHWFGNEEPERKQVAHAEVQHLWDGDAVLAGARGSLNAAQRVLDGVSTAFTAVSSVTGSVIPTQTISDYISDSIAPSNWTPNSEIVDCSSCRRELVAQGDKHHCRSCGRGFCDDCTQRRAHVSGYGRDVVRVCNDCAGTAHAAPSSATANDTKLRQYSEYFASACSSVYVSTATAIKDFARPAYWQPDEEVRSCCVCDKEFGRTSGIHHCRRCGLGVCAACSEKRQPVPARGWDTDVRVCDNCYSCTSA